MITRGLCISFAENISVRLGIFMCCSQQNNNNACHRNPIILFHPTLWTDSTMVLTQTDSTAQPLPTSVPSLSLPNIVPTLSLSKQLSIRSDGPDVLYWLMHLCLLFSALWHQRWQHRLFVWKLFLGSWLFDAHWAPRLFAFDMSLNNRQAINSVAFHCLFYSHSVAFSSVSSCFHIQFNVCPCAFRYVYLKHLYISIQTNSESTQERVEKAHRSMPGQLVVIVC